MKRGRSVVDFGYISIFEPSHKECIHTSNLKDIFFKN